MSRLHAVAITTTLFWLIPAVTFWAAGMPKPAGIALAISAIGAVTWGYFAVTAEWDKRHTRNDIAEVVCRGDYVDLRPVWPAEAGSVE
ncbi:hypothetical protein [Mycolicibacterium sphagni]|uniref:Uncharacterized protein n=1 Tax=Mycolicibacterium sphagni TaxID=1786 RepID=A0A255DDY4_9MYCO|nr:hypothetical protein [Mycolicibacterium sphagni]OYN76841.1 hypothetical protein CG716_20215 [Mycolicibacterium sphagni]